LDGFFPDLVRADPDFYDEIVFQLGLRLQGTGLGWQPSEVLSLPVNKAIWYVKRLLRERRAEKKAIEAAYKKT